MRVWVKPGGGKGEMNSLWTIYRTKISLISKRLSVVVSAYFLKFFFHSFAKGDILCNLCAPVFNFFQRRGS